MNIIKLSHHGSSQFVKSVSDNTILLSFLKDNFKEITSFDFPNEGNDIFLWKSLTIKNSLVYRDNFAFHITNGLNDELSLIDNIGNNITPTLKISFIKGTSHNDSISFFIRDNLKEIIEKRKELDENEFMFELEKGFSNINAIILLDNFSWYDSKHQYENFIKSLFASNIWKELKERIFENYYKFLINLGAEIIIQDYCVNNLSSLQYMIQENSKEWIFRKLYRVHSQSLILLSIPEIFIKKNVFRDKYHECLTSIGIIKDKNDNEIYRDYIDKKSIKQIYESLFSICGITNFKEFIQYCKNTIISDINIGLIIHIFRVIFNKVKHSSKVEIINSFDYEEHKKRELERIDKEIDDIEKGNKVEDNYLLISLKAQRTLLNNVTPKYKSIDFKDNSFVSKNGINIIVSNTEYFMITLEDVEYLFKILSGVLVIQRK